MDKIAPFLQRAKELESREPIVSYYCKLHAANLAISTQSDNRQFLSDLLDDLEKTKSTLAGNEQISNEIIGFSHVEAFALRVFNNSDNEDRNGQASKKTARGFFAASLFLEVLSVFGDLSDDIRQKIKYAKFKAADILKALNEGKIPQPGAPGETAQDVQVPNTSEPVPETVSQQPPFDQEPPYDPYKPKIQSPMNTYIDQPPIIPSPVTSKTIEPTQQPTPYIAPLIQQPPQNPHYIAPVIAQPPHQVAPPITFIPTQNEYNIPGDVDPFTIDHQTITNAQKAAKFAISALQYEDINSAVDHLKRAILLLEPFRK